jgi:hypothetical protein
LPAGKVNMRRCRNGLRSCRRDVWTRRLSVCFILSLTYCLIC